MHILNFISIGNMHKQEVGWIPSAAVAIFGGGVCLGEVSARGVSTWGGSCLPRVEGCTPPPPWTEFLTQACENLSGTTVADGKKKMA